ncbi:MAG: hypothetical protein ACAI44_38780, partial [Candidatus Sericytochromatia bacterium]
MQKYISKSSASTADVKALTGSSMIQDIKNRASALEVPRVQSNAGSIKGWFQQSSLGKFFAGKGSEPAQDGGQLTKLGEAVGETGGLSKLVFKGPDDTLKIGSKTGDIQKTTDALKGRPSMDSPDPVKDTDIGAATYRGVTGGVAFIKAGYDGIQACSKFGECSQMAAEATQKGAKAVEIQSLRGLIGTIASGKTAAIDNDAGFPDDGAICKLVDKVQTALPGVDTTKLTLALSTAGGRNLHQDYLSQVGTQLNQLSLSLMDESVALKHQASVGRREAGMELGKSTFTMIEKGATIASKVIDVTSRSAIPLAHAAAVTGIAATVVATA